MNHDFTHCKRVLVYRLGSMGDALHVMPAFHLVRRTFPHAHITLLTNEPASAKAVPMESILQHTNLYDDLLCYPASLRGVGKMLKLRRSLAAGNYDCLVYLTEPKGGIVTSIRDYLFFRLCGIRRIIGVPFSRRTLRHQPVPGSELHLSETARVLECVRRLGTVDLDDPRSWDLHLTSDETGEGASVLRDAGISGRFIAASVGTKIQANDWEEQNWESLMGLLAAEYPSLPLVMFGASEERERSGRLLRLWRGPKVNLCGTTTPRVSAAILCGAALMICHDSGPMHLAAAAGAPCVAIFSARNPPGVWFPRGEKHTMLYHRTSCWGCKLTVCTERKKECILSISVGEVYAAVKKHLSHAVPECANEAQHF